MPVALICPNLKCRTILQVPDTARGKRVRCGKCGRDFIVPAPDDKKAKKTSKAGTDGD